MRRRDYLLLTLLILISVGSLCTLFFHQKEGSYVEISAQGTTLMTLPLSKDTTVDIPLPDGEKNTIVIENSTVRMTEANCPDQTCESTGTIDSIGETIICLPHKVVIRITDEYQSNEFDAIVK